MMGMVFLDGRLVPEAEAGIRPSSQGFLYGASLFETLRIYGGRFFRLPAHLARMARSAEALRFRCPAPGEMESALRAVIEANGIADGRARLTLFRGDSPESSHLLASASPGIPYSEEQRRVGLRAQISALRLDPRSPLAGHKTGNYLPNLLAREAARQAGCEEAILLSQDGSVAEGSASNLFLATKGELVTPDLASGILAGITRRVVLDLAEELGIEAAERGVRMAELESAGEVFLTNSLMEVMPLVEVDRRPIGDGAPGPMTRRLMEAYQQRVLLEVRG